MDDSLSLFIVLLTSPIDRATFFLVATLLVLTGICYIIYCDVFWSITVDSEWLKRGISFFSQHYFFSARPTKLWLVQAKCAFTTVNIL